MAELFRSVDVPADDAWVAADALVAGEMRGVTTHGLANLGPRYLPWIEDGFINPRPDWQVTRGRGGLVNVDGDRGLGVVVAARVMDHLVEFARDTGIAMATVHNSRHLGMAAYYAMRALGHGIIGTCTTAVRARMVPTFGREPRLGTNPIAVAVPAGEMHAFVFDAATTTVASNKLRLKADAGGPAPPGWMVTADGAPVREPAVPAEPYRLAPLGGTPEGSSHKGYGLAVVVDILGKMLSQASFGARLGLGELKTTPPAPGHERVLVAGQLEHEAAYRHEQDGLALPSAAVAWRERCAERFEVHLPDLVLPAPATDG